MRSSISAPSPSTRSTSASARISLSSPSRARTYVTSGSTAIAACGTSVHGIVVHASSETSGSSSSGNFTKTDGSTTSL
jgi:hypothetical protein